MTPLPKLIRITTVPLSLDKLLEGQLRYMSAYYDVTAISAEPEYLARIGKREGVAVHAVPLTRKITPFQDLWCVVLLTWYFLRVRPQIVHTHTPKAGLVGMLAARLAFVPVRMHTVAGLPLLETTGFKRRVLEWVERFTYRMATQVYSNSEGLRSLLVAQRFCAPHRIKVLCNGSTNGIRTSYFSRVALGSFSRADFRESIGIPADAFVFVFVGRLVTDKGINELVGAFRKLTLGNPHLRLLLVGPLEPDLDPLHPATLEALTHCKTIVTVGYQADVRPYLAVSDALVFPSYREGFPNVVLQAGAMDLPVIATTINGCNEIILPPQNGLLVPPKDERALLEAMTRFLEEPALREAMAAQARDMIVSRYEQAVVWEALLGEYRGC